MQKHPQKTIPKYFPIVSYIPENPQPTDPHINSNEESLREKFRSGHSPANNVPHQYIATHGADQHKEASKNS